MGSHRPATQAQVDNTPVQATPAKKKAPGGFFGISDAVQAALGSNGSRNTFLGGG